MTPPATISAAEEALHVAEALGWSSPREVPATAPLDLDDLTTAWIVTRGRIVVFALPPGEHAHERRTTVVEVMTGGLLLAPPEDAAVRLIAVGIEPGTELRGLPATALIGHRGHRAAVLAGLVDDWLGALSVALESDPPQQGVGLASGETAELGIGDAAWAATRPVWVPAAELGLFESRPDPEPALLPVPARAWLRAYGELALQPERTAEALQHQEALGGIAAFHRALFAMLRVRIDDVDAIVADRIQRRIDYEAGLRSRTLGRLADVLGTEAVRASGAATTDELVEVMRRVGRASDIDIVEPSRQVLTAASDPLEAIARASGVRMRPIVLEPQWWRSDAAPFIGRRRSDGRPVAVIRGRHGFGYRFIDADGGSRRIDRTTAAELAPEGTALYRAMPSGPVTNGGIARFLLRSGWRELTWLFVFSLIGAGLALLPPAITEYLFQDVVPQLEVGSLGWMAALLVTSVIAGFGLAIVQRYAVIRIQTNMGGDLTAAIRDRLLDLPVPFYRRFSSGALALRVQNVSRIQRLITEGVIEAVLSLPTGVATLVFAFTINAQLGLYGLVAIVGIGAVIVLLLRIQMPNQRATIGTGGKVFALSLEMLGGIGKIRVADAHDRAFARWGEAFAGYKHHFYRAQRSFVGIIALVTAAPALGTMFLLIGAASLGSGVLGTAGFLAFNTAFVESMSAFISLTAVGMALVSAIPRWEELRPIFDEARETTPLQEDPGELRGAIEVDQVTFRYGPDEPYVLREVSFSAAPGEFVAIVGPSGAGKSSLLRLLLGFERPELGSIRYDAKEASWIDPVALRRQIGTVVQTAQVLPGDVLSNIIGTRRLSVDDAWEAARIAGVADDIAAMPMGMHTIIGEGGSGFSGGQRQRLLIARAVAGRPRILLFDEATSALDGPTQAAVSAAIERMQATRIVIAHRLSTIRAADRIVVLDAGSVVQQGTYDELVAVDGIFRRLALRQIA